MYISVEQWKTGYPLPVRANTRYKEGKKVKVQTLFVEVDVIGRSSTDETSESSTNDIDEKT